MEEHRAPRRAAAPVALGALAVLAAAGCGGGARQDADEPEGTFQVAIVRSSFPARQRIAQPARLVVAVRNTGDEALPNVAVTVDSFGARSEQPGLANAQRPVWVVDRPPAGSATAYVSTYALGRLPAGETRRFEWRLTPVQTGTHRLRYRVSAGLTGRAKATLAGNRSPEREVTVRITSRPGRSRVDPETGAVVRGGG